MYMRLIVFLLFSFPGTLPAQPLFQLAPPLFRYTSVFFEREQTVKLEFAQPGSTIHYTLNGGLPVETDPRYTEPFLIRDNMVRVQARSFASGFLPSDPAQLTFIRQGLSIQSVNATIPDSRYPGSGPTTLFDNRGGIPSAGSPTWMGYNTDQVQLDVKLERSQPVHSVVLHFLENQGSWIFLPTHLEVWVFEPSQNDYVLFERRSLSPESTAQHPQACVPIQLTRSVPLTTDQLRIRIDLLPRIPDWHPARGSHAWGFIDELKVY